MLLLLQGCAEGPLWTAGKYVPWARNQWAEEEQIANTIFTRKKQMNELVSNAARGTIEQKEAAARSLSDTIQRDPVLLMRLHAVKLLGQLDCPASTDALYAASKDHNSEVRIAAVQSWSKFPGEIAIRQLQEMIGSDTDVDVRLAATRALGNYQGKQAVQALSLALADRDPALQLRATESLQRATGESLGRDVNAWKLYVQQSLPKSATENREGQTAQRTPIGPAANDDDGSFFR
jgi:HEAT repeat protein